LVKHFLFCSKLTISCNFQQNFVYYKCNPLIHVNIYSKKILNFLSEIIKNSPISKLTIFIILISNIHALIFSILAVLAKIGRKLPSKSCNCRINHLIPSVFWRTSCQFYTNIFLLNGWHGKACKLPNIWLGNKMIYIYKSFVIDWSLHFYKKTIEINALFFLSNRTC
jgi:hypothetical protein